MIRISEDHAAGAEAEAGPQEGELILPFTLTTVAGRVVRRHDYRGRRHLLLFFAHGSGCAACAAVLDGLAARHADYRAEGAEVLAFLPGDGAGGRSPDPAVAPALPYPLLRDDDGRVGERYGARTATGEPRAALFVADRHGEVVLRAVAAEGPVGAAPRVPGALHGLPLDEALPLVALLQVRCAI